LCLRQLVKIVPHRDYFAGLTGSDQINLAKWQAFATGLRILIHITLVAMYCVILEYAESLLPGVIVSYPLFRHDFSRFG
jgi:hypothetical protein